MLALIAIGSTPPVYVYRDSTIELEIPGIERSEGELRVAWRELDAIGRTRGSWIRRIAPSNEEGRYAIEVGVAGGYQISLAAPQGELRIWATRGTWYALPRDNQITVSAKGSEGRALASTRDIVLAGAFSATVDGVRTRGPLEIGRTLGLDLGAAIRPPRGSALVIVGGATAHGVMVTLTERSAKGEIRYWDLPINFEARARRYVIPLSAFTLRSGGAGRMEHIEAIAIRTLRNASAGDRLFVDHVGLLESPPRVEKVKRRAGVVSVELGGKLPEKVTLTAHLGDDERTIEVKGAKAQLGGELARAIGVSICYREGEVEACDPPDAPMSVHPVPIGGPDALLVDDFRGETPLNALRLPTDVYSSTIGLDRTRISERRRGSIRIGDLKKHRLEYAGYRTRILPEIPPHLTALEISLRSTVSPENIKIGLRSKRGEPRVSLDRFASSLVKREDVRIPLSAFGARVRRGLDSISVTLEATSNERDELEIYRIRLVPGQDG